MADFDISSIVNSIADSVTVTGATLSGGAGKNQFIYNTIEGASIQGNTGNDVIISTGDYVSIQADVRNGGGANDNDIVVNKGNGNGTKGVISGSNGEDTLFNGYVYEDGIVKSVSGGSTVKVWGGKGNDLIYNVGLKATIYGQQGSDTIYNYADSVIIDNVTDDNSISSASKNYIMNYGSSVKISCGAGGDSIENNGGKKVTIFGGKGADSVHIYAASSLTVDGGDNNDIIINDNSSSISIVGGKGADSIENNGGSKIKIFGGEGADSIHIHAAESLTIDGGDNDDIIINDNSSTVSIIGGKGADSIYNRSGNAVEIDGGADNDYIFNDGSTVTVYGGEGADSIISGGSNVTIEGNEGDNFISLSAGAENNVIRYNTVTGGYNSHNVVKGFDSNDKVYIANSIDYMRATVGSDVVITLLDSLSTDSIGDSIGTITLQDTASLSNVNISGGILNNTVSGVTLTDNNSTDKIKNFASNVTIEGKNGDDQITLGSDVTNNVIKYKSGEGNDTIFGLNEKNSGFKLQIGDGKVDYSDLIVANNGDIVVKVDTGSITFKDILLENVDKISINNKEISLALFKTGKIELTPYKDVFEINTGNISVDALNGDDSILSNAEGVTIIGGAGNDTISLSSDATNNLIQYSKHDGKDIIYGFNETTTLQIGDGEKDTYYFINSEEDDDETNDGDNNIIVTVGKGKITLVGAATLESVDWTKNIKGMFSDIINISMSDDDSDTVNTSDGASIKGNAKNNFIQNNGEGAKVYGEAGNDSINNFGDGSSVFGGDDDDILQNISSEVLVKGENGADNINNWGSLVTIDGGEGNDKIYSAAVHETSQETYSVTDVLINSGIGDDSINNYSSTVTIDAGEGDNTINNKGNNVIITTYDGKDVIGSQGNDVEIYAGNGANSINSSGNNVTIESGDDDDTILSSGSDVTITSAAGNDSIYVDYGKNVSINVGEGKNAIKAYLTDSTVESGSDNDKMIISGSEVSIESGAGNDKITVSASYSTINAGAGNDTIDFKSSRGGNLILYTLGDGADSIYNFSDSDTLSISGSKYSSAISGDNLILNVGGEEITIFDAAYISKFNIDGTGEPSDTFLVRSDTKSPVTVDSSIKNIISFGRTKEVKITGNALDNSIIGGTKADTLYGAGGADSLTGGTGADLFVYGEGNDVITDYVSGDKISLASGVKISDVTIDGNDVLLTTNNGSLKIIDGYKVRKSNGKIIDTDRKITFVEGKNSTSYIFDEHKIFDSGKTAMSLTSGITDTVFNSASDKISSKLKTIDASSVYLSTTVTGNKKNNLIIASEGGSSLDGGKGNDTLQGGNGADTFVYRKNEGNDFIVNYEDDDKISIVGGTVSEMSVNKTDVIFKIGSKKLTVKDANEKAITLSDNGTIKYFIDNVLYNESKTAATLSTNFSATGTTEIDAKTIDVTLTKKAVNISGNSKANSIIGGTRNDTLYGGAGKDTIIGGNGSDLLYGDAGADSLWGGKGNDTLYGGDGADTFVYAKGDGRDVIIGFGNDDLLELSSAFKASYNAKRKEITLKVSGGSIMFKDYTADTFHIGKNTYQIVDGSFKKK